jgi:O-antigen/teichoic acid export membrane protein
VREGAGLAIRLVGVLLLTRLIGPHDFGVYAGAFAVVTVLILLCQMGSEVYLIRRPEEPSRELYEQTFCFLCVVTAVICALAYLASVAVAAVRPGPFVHPFQVMLVAVPLGMLWSPALARLERSLAYGKIAVLEVGGDLVLYAVGVPLAAAGAGVWAPVVGQIASNAWLFVVGCSLARFRPALRWSTPTARMLLRFGFDYTPAILLRRAEYVVNPVVVGGFLGATSVGYVALVLRLVDTLSFVVKATWRLSIVVFGRVQDDVERLRRGFVEAMTLQVLVLAPILGAFALAAPAIVPVVFGGTWTPTLRIYPTVALGSLLYAVFNMHFSVLYVRGRALSVTVVSAWRLGLLLGASLVFVPLVGASGYGIASVVAAGAGVLADRRVRELFSFDYGVVTRALVACSPSLFAPVVPAPWRYLLPTTMLLLVADAAMRRQLAQYIRTVLGALRPRVRTGTRADSYE